jgi:peroxiredoxin
MAQFESRKEDIAGSGAQVVFVAAEKRRGIFKPEDYLRAHRVRFPFLLDEDRRAAKAYGVYQPLGWDAIRIARPATFVVARNGVIRFAYIGATQRDRAPLDEVLNAIRVA